MPGGVLFDVDGTLVDSNGAHAAAWAEALREFGIERAVDVVRPLIGMGGDKTNCCLAWLASRTTASSDAASSPAARSVSATPISTTSRRSRACASCSGG